MSSDSTNHRLCCTIVFTNEKYLDTSKPMQFKPTLFKHQLYLLLNYTGETSVVDEEESQEKEKNLVEVEWRFFHAF